MEAWHQLSTADQVKHTLQGSKVFKDYQRAIAEANDELSGYSDHYIDAIISIDKFEIVEDEFETDY